MEDNKFEEDEEEKDKSKQNQREKYKQKDTEKSEKIRSPKKIDDKNEISMNLSNAHLVVEK